MKAWFGGTKKVPFLLLPMKKWGLKKFVYFRSKLVGPCVSRFFF